MSFLNITLLFGLLAFAIPLLIHLLNKRKHRDVKWGAVHLLHQVVEKNQKRLKVEQWMLLLLRVAIPALLAFLMAKPVLTRSITWLQDQRVSTVFLLDNSYSMQAENIDGQTRFEQSRQAITEISEKLRDGSDIAVLTMGGQTGSVTDESTTDVDNLLKTLNNANGAISANAAAANLTSSVQSAWAELQGMDHAGKEIIIVSDFQANDWADGNVPSEVASVIEEARRSATPPSITLLPIGKQMAAENISVQSISASSSILAVDQKVMIRALIKNWGSQAQADQPIQLKVNDVLKETIRLSLGANQETQAIFNIAFDRAGTHVVEINAGVDSINADNRLLKVISVREQLPVLIAEGTTASRPLEGDGAFLELALQPFSQSRSQLKDLVVTNVLLHYQLDQWRLRNSKVCIMANVPKIDTGRLEQLKNFVQQGGGLIVFPGNFIDPQWYNREFFDSGNGLLPRQILALEGKAVGPDSTSQGISTQFFNHPAMAFFNDPKNGDLGRVQFDRWYGLGFNDNVSAELKRKVEKATSVVASHTDGQPFVVEKQFGRGKVLLVSGPADASWSNMPAVPVFVPMIQQWVNYLASSVEPPNNLAPGEKLVAWLPRELINREVQLTDPGGESQKLKVEKHNDLLGVIEVTETTRPGVYTVESNDGKTKERFAVNLPRDESDGKLLTSEQIEALGKSLDAQVVDSGEAYLRLDQERRQGTGIWKPFVWVLLIGLFGEVFLQQWISGRKLS